MKALPLGSRARTQVPPDDFEVEELRERIVDLEARIRALALSRRVLITLLLSADRRRRMEVARLKGEIEKLRDRNRRYARALTARRVVITRLRQRLEEVAGSED
jgi:hypothetical protein